MRAAIYYRVSTAEQAADGTSLETQERSCREYAGREGWELAGVYADRGESAKTSDRPEFLRLIRDVRRGGIDRVICHRLDRIARNAVDAMAFRAELSRAGARLVSVCEPITDDPLGRFVETLLAGMAQLDNEVRAERARRGMVEQAKRGGWVHQAPIGYRTARDNGIPSLVPDDPAAGQIAEAFKMVAAGARPVEARRQSGLQVSLSRFCALLRSPVYTAMVDTRLGRSEGLWAPLVDRETWARVQVALDGDRRRVGATDQFPLRGTMRCSVCDRPMRGSFSAGNGGRYGYYWCPNGHERMRRERVDTDMADALAEIREKYLPGLLRLRRTISHYWRKTYGDGAAKVATLDKQIERMTARRKRLLDAMLDGHIEPADFDAKDAAMRAEIAKAEVERHDARSAAEDMAEVLRKAESLLNDLPAVIASAHPDKARSIYAALFPNGVRKDRTIASQCAFNGLSDSAKKSVAWRTTIEQNGTMQAIVRLLEVAA